VRYHYDHLPEAALAWEAGRRWMDWAGYLGGSDPAGMAKFVRSGALVLEGPGYDLRHLVSVMRSLDIEVRLLDADQIRTRFPGLDPSRFGPPTTPDDDRFFADPTGGLAGFWVPDAGHVDDPSLAAHNLAHAAKAQGAWFAYRTTVEEIVIVGDRVAGVVMSDGRRIEAPVVVNAAGPWSAALNAKAGVLGDFATSTRPLEQEVVSLPAPERFRLDSGGTCVTDPDFGTYFRPHSGDTIIVGGMEPDCDPLRYLAVPEDATAKVRRETWDTQAMRTARRVPDLTVPNRTSGIVGVYDVTDDWIPLYDMTTLPGYYVAIGTSGHGFKQAPFVGELIAELVEQVESGHQHDQVPVTVAGSWTGATVDLGHFSRHRTVVPQYGMG
jgi:sarcosine oxidase subunit beta